MTREEELKIIKIISINENGKEVINEKTLHEWLVDFWGYCNFVPENYDNVIFVSVDGKEIDLQEIADKNGNGQLPVYFEHVADYLGFRD